MRAFLAILLVSTAAGAAVEAPNAVSISPRLDTSGQPKRAFLEQLRAEGYQVVIYLAPPTAADLEIFSRLMAAFSDRKVYVHCQANFRASSMVFLDRVIRLKEKPEAAYESVQRAWVPDATWKKFIADMLRANGIAHEPL